MPGQRLVLGPQRGAYAGVEEDGQRAGHHVHQAQEHDVVDVPAGRAWPRLGAILQRHLGHIHRHAVEGQVVDAQVVAFHLWDTVVKLSLQFHLWGFNSEAFVTVPPVGVQ